MPSGPAPTSDDAFLPGERQRYIRHLMLPAFGEAGQLKLKNSRVLIVGAGGLGSPAALYLAAAGVGHLGLIDPDVVDASNLQRQILHGTSDVGALKTDSAKRRLLELNPFIEIDLYPDRLTASNAERIIRRYDVVLDGSDNFPTRYLINDACHFTGTPWVYGSIFRFEGQVSVFGLPDQPCYRCLYPTAPDPANAPDCSQAGVLGVLPGVVGTLQATETIKLITGIGETLSGRVLFYDALAMQFRTFTLARDPDCPLCGDHPRITTLQAATIPSCTSPQPSHTTMKKDEINALELKAMLDSPNPPVLVDVREEWEYKLGKIGNPHWIPLNEFPQRTKEIPADKTVVIYCRGGGRSRKALDILLSQRPNACHLAGGILAWADLVDPSITKY